MYPQCCFLILLHGSEICLGYQMKLAAVIRWSMYNTGALFVFRVLCRYGGKRTGSTVTSLGSLTRFNTFCKCVLFDVQA